MPTPNFSTLQQMPGAKGISLQNIQGTMV